MKMKMGEMLGKYKYLLIVIAVGMVLLIWPSGQSESKPTAQAQGPPEFSLADLEDKLVKTLGKIDGVGRIEVVLTLKTGMETLYQTNDQLKTTQQQENGQTSQYQSDRKHDTLVVAVGSGVQQPVVVKQNYPEFLGALIVCDGGQKSAVAWQVVSAVTSLTGIPSGTLRR